MEVHAHAHTARKKWTHYFWEFLMLFLAVFCGFLAENQREHMVEHRREKEYMRSLTEDLQTDTANINSAILLGEVIRTRNEILIAFINKEQVMDSVEKLYQLNISVNKAIGVDFEDRTSSQLKNGGNMRLVRNKMVSDTIRGYWESVKVLDYISNRLDEIRMKATDVSARLFHNKYIIYADPYNLSQPAISILPGAKLITKDPELLAFYSNWRQNALITLNNYITNMKEIKNSAVSLIALIKKEYHLK